MTTSLFPETLDDEIVQAFDNVARTLAQAGAAWGDVISVESYHVLDSGGFEAHNRVMVGQFRDRMGTRSPIWTELGVAALGHPPCAWKSASLRSSRAVPDVSGKGV